MKPIYRIITAIILGIALAGLTACEEGPAERTGASIDNAVEKAGEKLNEAGDKMKDAVEADDKS